MKKLTKKQLTEQVELEREKAEKERYIAMWKDKSEHFMEHMVKAGDNLQGMMDNLNNMLDELDELFYVVSDDESRKIYENMKINIRSAIEFLERAITLSNEYDKVIIDYWSDDE
jgi:hypothetical protein